MIWQVLFFYLPLVFIVISSFIKLSETGTFEGFTLDLITHFFTRVYLKVIASSLLLALSTALLCLIVAFPLAYFMAFRGKKFKNMLLFLLLIPFWTNFLLHVYSWFYVLDNQGFVNTLLLKFHLIEQPLRLINSLFSIMVMMVYYYLPFMVLPLYSSLERFNTSLIEASFDLGATWFQTFRRILLPLSMGGIRAGFFLVYIPAFGEFAIPELMGGDKIMFVGNVVSQYILAEGTGSLGAAFTVISGIILLSSAALLYWLMGRFIEPTKSIGKVNA